VYLAESLGERYRVTFAFEATAPEQLTLHVGDEIIVSMQRENGWWLGALSNGVNGWFPASYVKAVSVA
jgi:hypothetical protein